MPLSKSLGRASTAIALCVAVVLGGAFMSAGLGRISPELIDPAAAGSTPQDRGDSVSVLGAVEERGEVVEAPAATTTSVPAPATSSSTTITKPSTTTPSSSSVPSSPSTTVQVEAVVQAPLSIAELGAQADEVLGYPWRTMFPDWTVVWAGSRNGVRALTFPDRKIVEMYVRDGDDPSYLARVLAHELGHVADIELNSDDDRAIWRDARGLPDSVPWWPTEGAYDFDTAAGDFAEGFATMLVGSKTMSNVGGSLTASQLDVMASLTS